MKPYIYKNVHIWTDMSVIITVLVSSITLYMQVTVGSLQNMSM
jgi:hypothetical protein